MEDFEEKINYFKIWQNMFKIIGFIPQTSQGLFSHEDKCFAINPPYKKFSVISILESEIDDSLPYIEEHAFYDELE